MKSELYSLSSNKNWMKDAKNLGKNIKDQLSYEDDVIIIDDDDHDTTVIKEKIENSLTSVVNCHIWIKPQFSTKPTNTEDNKTRLKNETASNESRDPLYGDNDQKRMNNDFMLQNLKDPLSDDDDNRKIESKKHLKTFVNSTHLHEPDPDCHFDKKEEIKDEIAVLRPKRYEESADPVVNLTRNALTILDTDEKVFQCPHCEYRNDKPGRVSSHIKKRHIKSRRYACTQCDYKASQRSTLDGHIRARHTKERPYTCMYCSYKAAQAGSLLQHIRCRHLK